MLDREAYRAVKTALRRAPVVVLAGPRQCGKTTLARQFLTPESVNYFDLESPPSPMMKPTSGPRIKVPK